MQAAAVPIAQPPGWESYAAGCAVGQLGRRRRAAQQGPEEGGSRGLGVSHGGSSMIGSGQANQQGGPEDQVPAAPDWGCPSGQGPGGQPPLAVGLHSLAAVSSLARSHESGFLGPPGPALLRFMLEVGFHWKGSR